MIYMLAVADRLPQFREEIANFSAIVYLQLCGFCKEGFLPLCARKRLRYFIVALLGPSI